MFNFKKNSNEKFNSKKQPEFFFQNLVSNFHFKNTHTGKFQFKNRMEFLISRTLILGSFNLRTD